VGRMDLVAGRVGTGPYGDLNCEHHKRRRAERLSCNRSQRDLRFTGSEQTATRRISLRRTSFEEHDGFCSVVDGLRIPL
jgi:hypothetical protein